MLYPAELRGRYSTPTARRLQLTIGSCAKRDNANLSVSLAVLSIQSASDTGGPVYLSIGPITVREWTNSLHKQ